MPQNASLSLFYELAIFWSAKKRRGKDPFFPTLHLLSRWFLQLQQYWHLYCFAILGSTSTVIHSVKQRRYSEIGPEVPRCDLSRLTQFLRERLQSAFTLANQPGFAELPLSMPDQWGPVFNSISVLVLMWKTPLFHIRRAAHWHARITPPPSPHTHIHNHVHAVAESSPTPNTLFSDSTSDDNHRSVPPASPTLPDRITWLTNSACFYYFYFLIKTAVDIALI